VPNEFKHVGSVEIMVSRIYPLDPYNREPTRTEAIVEPGHYPLMFDGYSHVWVMSGKLNGQLLRRGDGLMVGTPNANAIMLNIDVTFPSKLYGPDDWKDMIEHESWREGHPNQRLRLHNTLEEA
jgi:hypothetical protein